VLPVPPLPELYLMLKQLNGLLVGHIRSLSLANTRKLSAHIA